MNYNVSSAVIVVILIMILISWVVCLSTSRRQASCYPSSGSLHTLSSAAIGLPKILLYKNAVFKTAEEANAFILSNKTQGDYTRLLSDRVYVVCNDNLILNCVSSTIEQVPTMMYRDAVFDSIVEAIDYVSRNNTPGDEVLALFDVFVVINKTFTTCKNLTLLPMPYPPASVKFFSNCNLTGTSFSASVGNIPYQPFRSMVIPLGYQVRILDNITGLPAVGADPFYLYSTSSAYLCLSVTFDPTKTSIEVTKVA